MSRLSMAQHVERFGVKDSVGVEQSLVYLGITENAERVAEALFLYLEGANDAYAYSFRGF